MARCVHCGKNIVLVNWSMGPGWEHQPVGASFQDGMHTHCKLTVATPDTEGEEVSDAR